MHFQSFCCTSHYTEALDILEKMVQVTMMRGAQTGGVVTYATGSSPGGKTGSGVNSKALPQLKGVRSRVVNGKRTDLSKLVRAKVQSSDGARRPAGFVRAYSGHTRFATTSKATFDGTHPHQWCPPQPRRVYDIARLVPGGWATRKVRWYKLNTC